MPSAVAAAQARHPRGADPRHADPRPGGALPRGPRPADARGAAGGASPRARRPRPGRRRFQRPARQPVGGPPGPAVGHPPQAPRHRGVRLVGPAGHGRGGARLPQGGPPAHRGRVALPRARASCPTGPPSWPWRPVPSPCPSPSARTPRSPARCWPATPWARWSWFPSEFALAGRALRDASSLGFSGQGRAACRGDSTTRAVAQGSTSRSTRREL